MIGVTHQDLQGMGAWWQVDVGFGLAQPEVQVVLVVRDGLIERRQRGIDQ